MGGWAVGGGGGREGAWRWSFGGGGGAGGMVGVFEVGRGGVDISEQFYYYKGFWVASVHYFL